MDRKPTSPDFKNDSSKPDSRVQGEGAYAPARKRQKERRAYVENEGLVSRKTRETAGAPDGEDSKALREARAAEQRGRTP
jgi:hypothetical protein